MDSQDKYYQKKLEEINRVEHQQSTEKSIGQFIKIGIVGLILLVAYFAALFVLSPGVLVASLAIGHQVLQNDPIHAWIASIIVSAVFAAVLYLAFRDKNKFYLAYFCTCLGVTASSFFVTANGTDPIFYFALIEFLPIQKGAATKPSSAPSERIENSVASANDLATQPPQSQQKSPPSEAASETNNSVDQELEKTKESAPVLPASAVNQDGVEKTPSESSSTQLTVAFAPSFNCNNATRGIEVLICGDKELSKIDVELNQVYQEKMEKVLDKKSLKASQINWLKRSARACSDRDCLMSAYAIRLKELQE